MDISDDSSGSPKKLRLTARDIAHIAAFVLIIAAMVTLYFRINRGLDKVNKLDGKVDALTVSLDTARREILLALLAQKAEEITDGIEDNQERCLAIAKWIALHISNRDILPGDFLSRFAFRTGLCGTRADIFVGMTASLNIPAHVFNMYEMKHSCVQAYYNGSWHFFDVTYAGCFMKDGNVLSWDDIRSDPDNVAKNNLVVFPGIDRVVDKIKNRKDIPKVDPNLVPPFIDNEERMKQIYSVERIRTANTCGKLFDENPKILKLELDHSEMADKPFTLGKVDGNWDDIRADALKKKPDATLFYYARALGIIDDNFHVRWIINNTKPGTEYSIKLISFKDTDEGLKFQAEADGCEILSSAKYETPHRKREYPREWIIRFNATSKRSEILIKFDFKARHKGILLDCIEVAKHDPKKK